MFLALGLVVWDDMMVGVRRLLSANLNAHLQAAVLNMSCEGNVEAFYCSLGCDINLDGESKTQVSLESALCAMLAFYS